MELILALAGTALIGTAVAAMLSAVTYGSTSRDGMRTLVVRQKVVTNRLANAIRGARAVLYCSPSDQQGPGKNTVLVLWDNDANDNAKVDLIELRRIQWVPDPATAVDGTLWSYVSAPSAANVTYTGSEDFEAVTTDLIAQGKLLGTRWARGVSGWALTPSRRDPIHLTRRLTSRLDLGLDLGGQGPPITQTSLDTISLRSDPAQSGL